MMNFKRILAFVLSLCMVLTLAPVGTIAFAEENVTAEASTEVNLTVEELDSSEIEVDLTQAELSESDLALEQAMVDENGMIGVFIVMEGESIIEEDASAVMNEDTQAKVEELEAAQAEVVAEIEETVLEGEALEVTNNYTWLFNGVAAQIPYSAMSEIAAMDGVKQVVVEPVYEIFESDVAAVSAAETLTASDGVMVGRESAWAEGYTGKGIKIAIIDTGLDLDHQNFAPLPEEALTADSATAESVEAVLANLNAKTRLGGLTIDEVYHSTKVAFAFNYADNTTDVTHANDEQGDHGTHVAGIAAANKVEESGVVGVAPDAQLYIMKVFGAARAGYASDIVAALEDALILGADVVNMSLGSNAGFTSSTDAFINSIYELVGQTNTILSVSAGNSYTAGFDNNWGTDANLTSNPDNAVIGEPGVYSTSLSVASVENWKIQRYYIQVSDGYQMGFVETSATYGLPSVLTLEGEYGVVAVPGYGEEADYEGLDVTGKVVLVSRGVISFPEKLTNASKAGAAACLIYNNASGELYMDLTDTEGTIPCASITMADGAYVISALEADPELTVSFPTEPASIPSAEAYQMSEFSSWGVAPDLSLEPDITAPGGNIYSTLDGGAYGLMSGTSMAAPNIAGISALVMQYAKANFDAESTDYRTLVQDLLMSTSGPLTYEDTELYYSPRSQGSGLANAYNAVTTDAYLTVDGCTTPKAELGDDADRIGSYGYTFTVHNFGENKAYYDLNTVVQSEGVDSFDYEDLYFMSSSPVELDAVTGETADTMVLTHDVDDDTDTDSHDAYLIYQAAIGNGAEGWDNEAFRYDTNCDDAVAADDVQAYLDALVGNESEADLADTVLCVGSGETADVSVSVVLNDGAKEYLDTYYTNGGYVEGYTFLTARNAGGVDLSLPYLAFYGSWDEAPMIDDGDYWELENAEEGEVVGNQYYNVLFSNFYGYESYVYPGFNVYFEDAELDPAHISISPNGDGSFDLIDDIYTSLLRNAATLTYRYSNAETGEVYHEATAKNASKSVYQSAYGQIIPYVYSWNEGEDGFEFWNWKKPDGSDLENNTVVLLEIEATGAYEGATSDTWSVPITIDLEAPQLLSAKKLMDLDTGEVTLELSFRDNVACSVVALMNSNGMEIYYKELVEDTVPDENGYQNYTATFDVTGLTGKVMVMLSDYAMNEGAYGLNIAGEGTPYGDLVGYSYPTGLLDEGWVSFSEGVEEDEVMMFMCEDGVVAAEYVAGYVFAQTDNGMLYGFKYEEMLKDTFDLEKTYIAQLDNVYQDLAYSYVEGQLFGLYSSVDNYGYPTSEIYTINLNGTEDGLEPYQEDWFANRGGVYGLTLAVDDAGTLYVLGTNYDWDTEELSEEAYLWMAEREVSSDRWGTYVDYYFEDMGSTGKSMDYLQSMTWDHNAEKLYWARFDAVGMEAVSELYEITLKENDAGETGVYLEQVGTLSGETCALFAPLTDESAAKEEHLNVPVMDTAIIGTPILREDTVTMNVTGTKKLAYDLDPWYTEHKEVVWSSSDESVVTVSDDGVINCIAQGSAVITVANAKDESKCDSLTVEVTALDLSIQGIITAQEAGLGNVTGTSTYKFDMVEGISSFGTVNAITASDELNYGLSLATSAYARESIWACEYGNTGMIYQISAETGEVLDALQPIDGDMLLGMTYSEDLDTFTGIMDMYLYVDLELTDEEQEKMLDSYDEDLHEFTYHKVNLLPYLQEAGGNFVTGENGNGASSEIVFCGITTLPGGYLHYDTYKDYLGNWSYSSSVNYTATQTLVLMDNVGRLWYIDEIVGMTKTADEWGNTEYSKADGSCISHSGEFRNGMFEMESVDDEGNVTYNVFNIRCINETPLTDMFRDGTMPRITYHFSDIEYAGDTADGAPMIIMSLYDYWNNGTTNELYLFIPEVSVVDDYTGEDVVLAETRLYSLGTTGENNIIATVHEAEVTGGVDPETEEETPVDNVETSQDYIEAQGVNTLAAGVFPVEDAAE